MINQSKDGEERKKTPSIIVEDFSKNESESHFSKFCCKRKLPNGKIVDHLQLIYEVCPKSIENESLTEIELKQMNITFSSKLIPWYSTHLFQ